MKEMNMKKYQLIFSRFIVKKCYLNHMNKIGIETEQL